MNRCLRSAFFSILMLAAMLRGGLPASAQLARERPDILAAVGVASLKTVKPGGSFEVQLRFRVKPQAWYYGPKPGGKIVPAQPATLTMPAGTPFTFSPPKWPATVVHETDLGDEKDHHHVYFGVQTVTIPVHVKPNAPKKVYDLAFTFNGQVCTTSTCIPVKASVSLSITVGDANAPNKIVFPAFPTGSGSPATPGSAGNSTGLLSPGAAGTTAPASSGSASNFDVTRIKGEVPKTSWALALLFAFLGGLIMNVMPCVLPVVPIKIYSFLEHAHQDHGKAVRLSLAFAAGMIAVFLVLGAIMASVRGLWGAQFQSPVFVTTLGAVMFVMALWLLGAFTIALPQKVAGARLSGSDFAGSFGMGALATVLATPCSGPFLGGAIAWAATQAAPLILLTFATVGIGMASPYVALVAQPKLLKRLPRPGPWMETWKQAMALVMFGVTIYFFNLLPAALHVPFLLFCLALGAGAWVVHRWGGLAESAAKRRAATAVALGLLLVGAWNSYRPRDYNSPGDEALSTSTVEASTQGLTWNSFDVSTLNRWLGNRETVVVEWTADWCPNCKYIENTVYRQPKVTERLKGSIKLMRADITHSFPQAEQILQKLGGQSIPFSVVFRGNDPTHPVILRDVYTADHLLSALGSTAVAMKPL